MRSPGLICSIVPVYIYPRHPLRTLSLSGTTPYILSSFQNPIASPPKCIRHFHKHPAEHPPLPFPHHSRLHRRLLSGTSRKQNTTRTPASPGPKTRFTMQRPSTPYNDPKVQGPRAQQLAAGGHSDLLRKMMNPVNTVNKTGLHPSGVAYVLHSVMCGVSRQTP